MGRSVLLAICGLLVVGTVFGLLVVRDEPAVREAAPGTSSGAASRGSSTGVLGEQLASAFGGAGSGSWLTTRLADDTAVHPDSAAGVAELVAAAGPSASPWINIERFTASVTVVPPDQPLVPVALEGDRAAASWARRLKEVLAVGVPIPSDLRPPPDSDSTVIVYQPEWSWAGDPSRRGSLWELWKAKRQGPGARGGWTAAWGGRLRDVSGDRRGHWYDKFWEEADPSAPQPGFGRDGVATEKSWGTMATGIPMMATLITRRDLQRGVIDHPIGYAMDPVPAARQSGPVWPAQRYDGGSRTEMPHGSRFRLPAGFEVGAARLDPLGPGQRRTQADLEQMIQTAMRDYGIVFVDTAQAGGVVFRTELGAGDLLPARFDRGKTMKGLPWGDLVRIAQGSDEVPNPTTSGDRGTVGNG